MHLFCGQYSVLLLSLLLLASHPALAQSLSIGKTRVSVAFSPPLHSISNAVLDIRLRPTFLSTNLLIAPASFQIRLSGIGISFPENATVSFILPFSGVAAVASINITEPNFPVVVISLTSGNLTAGYPVWLQISPASTTTHAQPRVDGVVSSITDRDGTTVADDTAGAMAAIVGGLGSNQPAIVVSGSSVSVAFTPSAPLPAQSSLAITLPGATFSCAPETPFISPSVQGAVSCLGGPLSSVIIAKFSTAIAAAATVELTFNVNRGCELPTSVSAAAADAAGNILAASVSGSISSSGPLSSVVVQQLISSATGGVIVLPSGVFAGKCNCNNVINETMPSREAGSAVSLQGASVGTTIDCSGTGMRCLSVYGTSIKISHVTFKGGSSPIFVSSGLLAAVRAVIEAVADMSPLYAPWSSPSRPLASASSTPSRPLASASSTRRPTASPISLTSPSSPRTIESDKRRQSQNAYARRSIGDTYSHQDREPQSLLPEVKALFDDDSSALKFLQLFSRAQSSESNLQNSTEDFFVALSKTLHLMRDEVKHGASSVASQLHDDWEPPGAFEGLSHLVASKQSGSKRKLLDILQQLSQGLISWISAMFTVEEAMCGGCLLVIHSEGFATLSGVNLISCSAVYGGGAFFNVSVFSGESGAASENTARQGGGLFVASTQESNLTSFVFLRNTVASWSISGFTAKNGGQFGRFTRMPDAAAAAGAGAWVESLGQARNCSFIENVALAATTYSASTEKYGDSRGGFAEDPNERNVGTIFGSHALGSGLFVLRMRASSTVSELQFSGCKSICAGWCISAGTLFVATVAGGSVLKQLHFNACESSAWASAAMSTVCGQIGDGCSRLGPSVAMAAGILIQDMSLSTPSSSISDVKVSACVVRAVGGAVGSCIMLQIVSNIEISHISFEKITVLVNGYASLWARISGLLTSDEAMNVKMWNVASVDTVLTCDGCPVGTVRGGVVYFQQCSSTSISHVAAHNLNMTCDGRGGYCNLEGGVIYINRPSNNVVISSTSLRHVILHCKGPNCNALGGAIYFDMQAESTSISLTSAYNVSLQCSSVDASGSSVSRACLAGGGVFHFHGKSQDIVVNNTVAAAVSVACAGQGCAAMAGVMYIGLGWSVKIENMRVGSVRVYSEGQGSSAVAATLSILAGLQCTVTNLVYDDGEVSSSGVRSAAFGGSISIFAGSVAVAHSNFSSAVVSCVGDKCSSLGGFFAIISSIQLDPSAPLQDYAKWDANAVVISSSSLQAASVLCSGHGCFASGGAVFAGVACRGIEGPVTMNIGCPTCLAPQMSNVTVDRCSLLNNSVQSASLNATVSGAAISLFPSIALLVDAFLSGNTLNTSAIGAFIGGAAVYAASLGTVATVIASRISSNDAGSGGSGGGIFVGPEAVVSCFNVSIEDNTAGKGGGLHIDGAHVSLSSTSILNNKAATTGGGLFCVSKVQGEMSNNALVLKGGSVIVLLQTTLSGNLLLDASETVGAAVYVYGAVRVETDTASNVFMNGVYNMTVTETVMSVNEQSSIQLGTICQSGTVLNIAYTGVRNQRSQLFQPTESEMTLSQCYPACLSTPQFTSYIAASGFLATCIPCPKLTYSFANSSNSTDSIASFCAPCPFGAVCLGGSKVVSRQGYWGWMVSDTQLSAQFLNLPEGYGCEEDECEAIDTCGHNHTGILCGSCNAGFSAAYFTTECVSDEECSDTKLVILVFASFLYAFVFSVFLRYEAEAPEDQDCGVVQQVAGADAADAHVSEQKDATSDIEEVKELRENSFLVLMWYYQLTGLLLTMPNSMALFDSGAFFTSLLGLVFGTVPVSQAVELPTLVFCTKAGSSNLDVLVGNLLFYAMWAVMMIVLTFKSAWLPIFRVVHFFSEATAGFWDNYDAACEALEAWGNVGKVLAVFVALQWTLQMALAGITLSAIAAALRGIFNLSCAKVLSFFRAIALWIVFIITCGMCCRKSSEEQKEKPSVQPGEVRGKAWLDWGVSAYSAILSLLVQCTTCVKMNGFPSDTASSDIRWFYDGRVVCFSDSGEQSGLWQYWALGGVVFMALVPLLLAVYMHGALKKSEDERNVFDSSALPYYADQFVSGSKHWFAAMFYQRIVMVFVIFYSISLNAPFIQGILAFVVCFMILVMDSMYQPYQNRDLQQLATVCSFLLVLMSAVLLRSQSLISSARQINFNPQQPDEAVGGSEASLPVDVLLCIGVIMACLTLPFAIMLKLHRQIGSFFVKVASSCRPRKVLPMPSHLKNP